ncbi:MAG: PKD domain-containing protein [Bdellovibrionales bacterium]
MRQVLALVVFFGFGLYAQAQSTAFLFGPKAYHPSYKKTKAFNELFTVADPNSAPASLVVENGIPLDPLPEECQKDFDRDEYGDNDDDDSRDDDHKSHRGNQHKSHKSKKSDFVCKLIKIKNNLIRSFTHVKSLELRLNGTVVIANGQFNQMTNKLVIQVPVQSSNQMKITVRGPFTSFITVSITREASANLPPIAAFNVAPGPQTDPLRFHFDGTASADPDGSIVSYQYDFGDGESASTAIADHKFAANGSYSVSLTVTDDQGAQNSTVQTVVVNDVTAPILSIAQPNDGDSVANVLSVQVVGSSNEPLQSASVNGQALPLAPDGRSFAGLYTAPAFGSQTLSILGTDQAGNTSQVQRQITFVLNQAPSAVITLKTTGGIAPLLVLLDGSASSDPEGSPLSYDWDFGDGSSASGALVSHIYQSTGSFTATLTVRDNVNQSGVATRSILVENLVLPPDPVTTAPAQNFAGISLVSDTLNFLFSGANPTQIGTAIGAIDPERATLLRGLVKNFSDQPIPGVSIKIKGRPELGHTMTRADGKFDLAVNGGGTLIVEYDRNGYLPVQRKVETRWGDMRWLDDVIMVPLDTKVTPVAINAPQMQIARGNTVTDADGTRTGTLLVPANTTATASIGGSTQSLDSLSVRITEFTVGENGRQAMPATLPPTSAYTYAMEVSADEALVVGADKVTFNQPLYYYVEDFIGEQPGIIVPVGFFDKAKGNWVAEDDGIVVKILDIQNGQAVLTIDDPNPLNAAQIASMNVTPDELTSLAQIYPIGAQLWRVPISHFSTYDCNNPFVLPIDAGPPDGAPPIADNNNGDSNDPKGPNKCPGSIIEIENQVLSEQIPITNTPFNLVYRTDRVKGTPQSRSIKIGLTGDISNITSLKRVDLSVTGAGQTFKQSFPFPQSYLNTTYNWDGNDPYERPIFGARSFISEVSYIYEQIYIGEFSAQQLGGAIARTFALAPRSLPAPPGSGGGGGGGVAEPPPQIRKLVAVPKASNVFVESRDSRAFGMGGWTIDQYHFYSPAVQKLYLGTGSTNAIAQYATVDTIAGTGLLTGSAPFGDGGPAKQASIVNPTRVRVAPNGDIFVVDSTHNRVRRIDRNGIISTVLGGGTQDFTEGMLATDWRRPPGSTEGLQDIAVGQDGTLYVALTRSVFAINELGFMHRYAGDGLQATAAFNGDMGPATSARFIRIREIDTPIDGGLFIVDELARNIRRVKPDGVIYTYAGNGGTSSTGDGGLATDAGLSSPISIAAGPNGFLYIADRSIAEIRRIRPDGIIESYLTRVDFGDLDFNGAESIVAAPDGSLLMSYGHTVGPNIGNGIFRISPDRQVSLFAGQPNIGGRSGTDIDGKQPLESTLSVPAGLAIDQQGNVLLTENSGHRVRRIRNALPAYSGQNIRVASRDGGEYYIFTPQGLHLETRDTLTGALKLSFQHNSNNLLTSITDLAGNVTQIQRDSNGQIQSITSPYGQITNVSVDPSGYLTTLTNPNGEQWNMSYEPSSGLMQSFRDPNNNETTFQYDARGRLNKEVRPNNGFLELLRADFAGPRSGYEILASTADGIQTTYRNENLSNGKGETVQIYANGATSSYTGKDGVGTRKATDNRQITEAEAPDPIFGLHSPFMSRYSERLPSGLTSQMIRTKSATFTELNNLISVQSQTESTQINNRTFTSQYNGTTRTMTETSPQGRITSLRLDTLGRPDQIQLANLDPVQINYDTRGRLSQISQNARAYNYTYNSLGLLETATDPLNQVQRFSYDNSNRLTQQQLPDGRFIAFNYDQNGNLTGITPPGRPIHQLLYNSMNRLSEYLPPNLITPTNTTYAYSLDNKLTSIRRPDGALLSLNYDAQKGHLNSIITPLGTSAFTYSPTTGQLQSSLSPDGITTSFTYDGPLLISNSSSGGVNGSITRTYNNNYFLTNENLGGQFISYAYDNDGLLTQAGTLSLSNDPTNGLITQTQIGVITESMTYNTLGEQLSQTSSLASFNYVRDSLGRITEKTETLGASPAVKFNYIYDNSGRLTQVLTNGALSRTYAYDSNSNRVGLNGTIGTYDIQDRLTAYGNLTFGYNANGEMISKNDSGQITQYSYDNFGTLKSVTLPNGNIVQYFVDAQNRRVGKKLNGTLVQGFLYRDDLRPAVELNGSGAAVAYFIYGSKVNIPDYMIKGGVSYKIISDQIGSPRLVVRTSDGAIMQRMDFNEFGIVIQDSNPGFQPFGFAGGIYDRDTELVHFGAREYSPEIGRWTSKDPIGFDGGILNLYNYPNDPVNRIDLDGLQQRRGPRRIPTPRNSYDPRDQRGWVPPGNRPRDPTRALPPGPPLRPEGQQRPDDQGPADRNLSEARCILNPKACGNRPPPYPTPPPSFDGGGGQMCTPGNPQGPPPPYNPPTLQNPPDEFD